MSLSRVKVALGAFSMCAGFVLATSGPGSAATLTSSKGTDPNGAFCKLYRSETSSSAKETTKLEKEAQENKWNLVQKTLESEFKYESKVAHELTQSLASAPSNVRSAASTSLKAVPSEEKVTRTSTSVNQYETALNRLFNGRKLNAAEKVLEQYETTTCGTAS